MDFLNVILPIILYILGIALLIVLIILGIKLIQTVNKTNRILDDAEKKLASLNDFFYFIDNITDKMSFLSDKIINALVGAVSKIFNKKKKEEDILDE